MLIKSLVSLHLMVNVFGVLMVLSSENFLSMFVWMEISTFFFFPILLFQNTPPSLGGAMKYFLAQMMGASLFLMGNITGKDPFGFGLSNFGQTLVWVGLLLKLGVFPPFGWLVLMIESMSWHSFFYLLTVQKAIPLIILSKFISEMKETYLILSCFSLFVTSLLIFSKKNSVRMLLVLSSNLNLMWLILSSSLSTSALDFFYITYVSHLLFIFLFFDLKVSSMMSSFLSGSSSLNEKLMKFFLIFTVSGLPPFGVFLGKLEVLLNLLEVSSYGMPLIFIIISSIVTWVYSKLMINLLISSKRRNLEWLGFVSVSFIPLMGALFLFF